MTLAGLDDLLKKAFTHLELHMGKLSHGFSIAEKLLEETLPQSLFMTML